MVLPAMPSFFAINLLADFPAGPSVGYHGLYGARTYGPYADLRFVYSHASDPACADDDLVINGVVLYPDDFANPINGGATTLFLVLRAGDIFSVNIRNAGGPCSGSGSLRLYNRPI